MNFNPYQNYGAGIAALGPVQAMSDRNEAQTIMANNGQMYASGGITRLAEGGDTSLPTYKYDPETQTYVLDSGDKAKTEMEEELLRRKRAAQASGGGGNSGDPTVTDRQAKVFDFMNTPEGKSYKDDYGRANSALIGSFLPGTAIFSALQGRAPTNPFTAFLQANAVYAAAEQAAKEGRINNLPTGYETVGGPGTYSPTTISDVLSGYQTGQNGLPSELGGSATPGSGTPPGGGNAPSGGFTGADSGGMFGGAQSGDVGFAYGGLAALARGGMSHLGDYSDGGRLLRGPGDGVSDSIPATIGDKRPARLADGEFVVPARIVSELGNGSTEAGARKLYAMMDRIQKARGKTVGKDRVAVNSRADKNLPA